MKTLARPALDRRNTVPQRVNVFSVQDAEALVRTESVVIFDVRTYTEFIESRVHGAVNLCIPSTLLKRGSFDFRRMREFVPNTTAQALEKVGSATTLLLYDSKTASLETCGPNSLLHTIRKLCAHVDNADVSCKVGFISGGITAMQDSELLDNSKLLDSDIDANNPLPPVVTGPVPMSMSCNVASSGLAVSEELFAHLSMFPPWIRQVITESHAGRNIVSENWRKLQLSEQARVQHALSNHNFCAGDMAKNRYANICPYSHTRVVLRSVPDYINASYVGASYSPLRYIATQAPLPSSFADFWQLVWDEEVPVIVMLTTLSSETGQIKGDNYWVPGNYGDLELVSVDLDPRTTTGIILRRITLRKGDKTRSIHQIHYEHWPDVACPTNVDEFLQVLDLKSQILPSLTDRVVVHCSAGCGRTGTFCTVDSIIELLRSKEESVREGAVDLVNETVSELRQQRLAMVQVQSQFLYCYNTTILWYFRNFIEHSPRASKLPTPIRKNPSPSPANHGSYPSTPSWVRPVHTDMQ